MGTRAILAVAMDDGTLLASNVASDGDILGDRLRANFPTIGGALGLVVLGDLMSVASCGVVTLSPAGPRPNAYADLDALNADKLGNAHHIHLFRDGTWEHLLDDEGQFQEWLASLLDAEAQPDEDETVH